MPFVIGLTGNIACGKSTVGRMLAELGAQYVDADALVHELLRPGTEQTAAVARRFGPEVLGPDGGVDRAKLGRIVFRDPAALRDLEQILHPAVIARVREIVAQSTSPVVVVDAIKLIESGLHREVQSVWVVTCRPEQQEERLVRLRGLSPEEAAVRIAAQPPADEKLKHADVVIDNSGSLAETRRQVEAAWKRVVG